MQFPTLTIVRVPKKFVGELGINRDWESVRSKIEIGGQNGFASGVFDSDIESSD
jgi:hypothetical protein